MVNMVEEAVQGAAKLHCFGWGKFKHVGINAIEGQVNNQVWPAILLRNAT
jgi:hypothetical protein